MFAYTATDLIVLLKVGLKQSVFTALLVISFMANRILYVVRLSSLRYALAQFAGERKILRIRLVKILKNFEERVGCKG